MINPAVTNDAAPQPSGQSMTPTSDKQVVRADLVQGADRQKADEDRRESVAQVENELLDQVRIENDNTGQQAEDPEQTGDERLEDGRADVKQFLPPTVLGRGGFLGLQRLVVLLVHVAGIGVKNIGDRAVGNGGNLIAPIHQLREHDDVHDGPAQRSQDGLGAAATRDRGQHHAGDEKQIRHRHQHRLQGGATRSEVRKHACRSCSWNYR